MTKHVDVTLQRWQVAYAMEEAERRDANASAYRMRHGSTKQIGLSSIEAHKIGAVCELAVAYWSGIEERFFDENVLDAPDVGLIEVRGTRNKTSDLTVYAGDVEKSPYMVLGVIYELSDEGAIVRLEGWADSEHAWRYSKPAPYPPHPKRGQAHYYSRNALHRMSSLLWHHRFTEAWNDERILTR